MAQFIIKNTTTQFRCKIPRNDNKTARTLAKFAWHGNVSSVIPSYDHYPPRADCPFPLAMANFHCDDFDPILVNGISWSI
jgi:hypothetical protein